MRRSQKGFGAIEGLLILVILGIIGFTGWYTLNSKNKTDSTLNSTGKTTAAASKNTSATINPLTTTAASKLVSDFYSQYYKAASGTNGPNTDQMKSLVTQYGSTNLIKAYSDAQGLDPISCGQNFAPATVTSSKQSNSKVVVSVHEAFTASPIDFTVDVVNSSGLKIDAANCPSGT